MFDDDLIDAIDLGNKQQQKVCEKCRQTKKTLTDLLEIASVETSVIKRGTVVTLLASYCDDGNCTDNDPCEECVKMCNQFVLEKDAYAKFFREVGQ